MNKFNMAVLLFVALQYSSPSLANEVKPVEHFKQFTTEDSEIVKITRITSSGETFHQLVYKTSIGEMKYVFISSDDILLTENEFNALNSKAKKIVLAQK